MDCGDGCISIVQCDQENRSIVTGATALILVVSMIQFFCLLKFSDRSEHQGSQVTNETPPPYSEET